jgi:hypothetical protein
MIHGDGVSGKYNVIVAGRQAELYAGAAHCDRQMKNEQLWEFIQEVRSSTREEFEQWYDLYKDTTVKGK